MRRFNLMNSFAYLATDDGVSALFVKYRLWRNQAAAWSARLRGHLIIIIASYKCFTKVALGVFTCCKCLWAGTQERRRRWQFSARARLCP